MTRGHLLPLPTSSDMNQLAHPGGGTQVTDASREGLVEDLFEAHLRHLDIATKGAAAGRLAALATTLEQKLGSSHVKVLDDMILAIAVSESAVRIRKALDTLLPLIARTQIVGSPDTGERVVGVGRSSTSSNMPDVASLRRDLERAAATIAPLIQREDYPKILQESRTLLLTIENAKGSYVLNNALGTGSLWGYSDEAEQFMQALKTIVDEADTAVRAGRGPSPEADVGASRMRVQTPAEAEMLKAFADRLNAMVEKYNSLDSMTEDWKDEMSPQNYQKLHAEFLRKIPNLGYLNRLDKYKERLDAGQISPASAGKYAATLDSLDKILSAFEREVDATNARLLGGVSGGG